MKRNILLLLTSVLLLPVPTMIQAQIIPTYTSTGTLSYSYTSPYLFQFQPDGTLIAQGSYAVTGTLSSTDQGAGVRMLWYPRMAAFRAGRVTVTPSAWDESNIGLYSAAFGEDTEALGHHSFAAGYGNSATGIYSVSFGSLCTAAGNNSTAIGSSASATVNSSFAEGNLAAASGFYAVSMGAFTTAASFNDTVFGRYNLYNSTTAGLTPASSSAWTTTDPLLEVGNGSSSTPSNAFTVYKNGTATVQGVLTANGGFMTTAASVSTTDIPMYGH